jgi:hypothetical protein
MSLWSKRASEQRVFGFGEEVVGQGALLGVHAMAVVWSVWREHIPGVVRSVGPGTEFNVTADHVGVARTDGLDVSLFVLSRFVPAVNISD